MPTIEKVKKMIPKTNNMYNQARRKIYDSERWRRLREWKLINNPLCELCLKDGNTVPAEDIHHIVSFMEVDDINERKRLAYDYDNLMSLCKRCHQRIHNNNEIKEDVVRRGRR